MSYDKFGKSISSSLYRLSDSLWLNEVRDNIENLVEYIQNNDSFKISKDLEKEEFQKIVFGKKITGRTKLKKIRQAAVSVARIKNEFPEIINQLKTSGNRMFNIKSVPCIFFKHNERVWRIPEKNKEIKFQTANSFVLFSPSLSRVLSFETPEKNLSFERFRFGKIEHIQFQETFSKLKGNTRRKTIIEDKFANFLDIKFIFRTIHDAKIIYSGKRLEHFSFVTTDDAGEKTFKIAFYFITLGRILESTQFPVSSNKPANMKKIKISDSTGEQIFEMFENVDHTDDLMSKSMMDFFGLSKNNESLKFKKNNFVLSISRWGIGDNIPEILYLKNLGNSISQSKIDDFYMLAYLNTRKKVNKEKLRKMFPDDNFQNNSSLFSKNGWTYEINDKWDVEEFEKTIKNDRRYLDISKTSISQYLKINEFHHKLYLSENPEKEFADYYGLPNEKICPECGRELYELTNSRIKSYIQNNNGDVSSEYQSLFSFQEGILDVLENIKSDLSEIIGNKEKATQFVRRFFESKPYFLEDIPNLEICKILQDAFSCIDHLKERRMFFHFSKNPDIIDWFLKLETPKNMHIGNPKVIEIDLGKNCIEHGPVEQKTSENRGIVSYIIEDYAKKVFETKQAERFSSLSQTIKNICTKWYGLVDQAILNNDAIPQEKISETEKSWINFCNQLNDGLFSSFNGTKMNISQIKKIKFNETSFFILCYLVRKNELSTENNWRNLLYRISEYDALEKSNTAKQTGVIGDMDQLLRIIAMRFYNFHYQEALGNKQPFNSKVLYDNLSNSMERCTYASPKQNSRKFKNLQSMQFKSEKFRAMFNLLLTGEIQRRNHAESFLASYSKRQESRKGNRKQRGHSRVNYILEAKKLMSQHADSRNFSRNTRKNFQRNEKSRKKFTKKIDTIPVKQNNFEMDLEELGREWRRAKDAKSQTHAPQKYQEIKNSLQPKVQEFMNYYSKTCPAISILRGKTLESKETKKFFNLVSQSVDLSKESVTKMMNS